MLSRKPAERGTPTKIITQSDWFRGFDWEALISRSLIPKYIPKTTPVNPAKFKKEPVEVQFTKDEQGYQMVPPKVVPPPNWDANF
jgi:hypothetical protein